MENITYVTVYTLPRLLQSHTKAVTPLRNRMNILFNVHILNNY